MIRPTPRFLVLVIAGLIAAILPVVAHPSLWWPLVVYDAVLVVAFAFDAFWAPSSRELTASIEAPVRAYVGWETNLKAVVRHERFRPRNLEVRINTEGPIEPPHSAAGVGHEDHDIAEWTCSPTNRGVIDVLGVSLRWTGPLGLVHRSTDQDIESQTTVVPDIRSVRRAAIRLNTHHTFMSGLKTRRFVGDGSEFESLRKHQPGLDHRLIDWKASAKHRKLLCRENRSERNHRVILAFDTGRLMCEPIEGVTKLDHAINAGLLLGYLSLKMGDRVGVLGFDSEVHAFMGPQPGIRAFQKLSQVAADLPYADAEANYTLALTELSRRLRRRSVVVVLTDFIDTITGELMIENIDRLARRHLVVFCAIRDPDLDALVDAPPDTVLDINRATVAHEVLTERRKVLSRLRRSGIFCIDCRPDELSVSLINRYLDIHQRELI